MEEVSKDVVVVPETNGVVVTTPNYNKNLGDKVIQISIKVAHRKASNGKKFKSIKGLKHITVIDEEGENIGKHNRWLDVHFTMDAFKVEKGEGLTVTEPQDLKTGFLYVKAKHIQSPRVYKVVEEKDKDGNVIYNEDGTAKLKYPEIWIDGGIVGFEEYVSDQDEFTYVEPVKNAEVVKTQIVDEETGEILNDEEVKL